MWVGKCNFYIVPVSKVLYSHIHSYTQWMSRKLCLLVWMTGSKYNSYGWETAKLFQYWWQIWVPLLPSGTTALIYQPSPVTVKLKSHIFLIYRSDRYILIPLNIQHFLSMFLNNWSLSICSESLNWWNFSVCVPAHKSM